MTPVNSMMSPASKFSPIPETDKRMFFSFSPFILTSLRSIEVAPFEYSTLSLTLPSIVCSPKNCFPSNRLTPTKNQPMPNNSTVKITKSNANFLYMQRKTTSPTTTSATKTQKDMFRLKRNLALYIPRSIAKNE